MNIYILYSYYAYIYMYILEPAVAVNRQSIYKYICIFLVMHTYNT